MADVSKLMVDGVAYDLKDAVARTNIGDLSALGTTEKANLVEAINEVASAAGGGECGITYLESNDTNNMVSIRDLGSGTYVLYGRFKPFAASTATLTFSSKLLVNVVKQSTTSHVMVFYPVNNCVQYLKVTDDAYERTNIYLNDLNNMVTALNDAVGINIMDSLATTDKSSLVAAINEVAGSAGGTSQGSSRVLLYENESIHNDGSFPAAKLTATDMVGEYSGVEVLFYCKRGGSLVSSGFIPKDTLTPYGAVVLGVTSEGELVTRTVKHSGNVFMISDGTVGTEINNGYLLPWRIYGFK